MATDLELAFKALTGKKPVYDKLFRYYDGDQPLLYTNKRLEEIFAGLDVVFTENWCSVVIDAVKDRINLSGLSAPDSVTQDKLDELWSDLELGLEADEAHEAALVTGEGFVIAWPDEDGQPQAFANDPRLCHVFYESDDPRIKRLACKWWANDSGGVNLNLYYPDRIEYYQTPKPDPTQAGAFQPADLPSAPNPYGIVPIFHFRLSRRRTWGDLVNVVPIQNGINKLLTDMMVAAEYGAFSQRYVISNIDVLGKLKNAPNEIWSLPAGDGMGQQTQVGQFEANDLNNYLAAIDNLAMTLAAITRTPKHYFIKQGGDPSGEALIAMESPLTRKAQDRIDRFTPTWKSLAEFLLFLSGHSALASEITPDWDDTETVQPRMEAEITQIRVNSGVPLNTALSWEGKDDAEIAAMEKDRNTEKASAQSSLAKAMLDAERQFNAGGQQQPPQEDASVQPD